MLVHKLKTDKDDGHSLYCEECKKIEWQDKAKKTKFYTLICGKKYLFLCDKCMSTLCGLIIDAEIKEDA